MEIRATPGEIPDEHLHPKSQVAGHHCSLVGVVFLFSGSAISSRF